MSSLRFSWLVAQRYLWTRRSEAAITVLTIISVLGVAIGVLTLNIVMAVMTGFEEEFKTKILGNEAHVLVRRYAGRVADVDRILTPVAQLSEVESVSPFTSHQALFQYRSSSSGIIIKGIEKNSGVALHLASYLKQGEGTLDALFEPTKDTYVGPDGKERTRELPGILIGEELAKLKGLVTGSLITLVPPQVSSSPFGMMPRFGRFRVIGTYKSGLSNYEQGLAYMSIAAAQRFFRIGDQVDGLEVRLHDVDKAPIVSKKVMKLLPKGFYVDDWTTLNKAFFDAMQLEKRVYFLVLLLIIVMASFAIISSLVMIVLEKRKDIAVLSTLGASPGSIGAVFRFQGIFVGLVGVSTGTITSYLGCLALSKYGFPIDPSVFQMETLPVRIEPLNFLLVAISAFLICALSTIYPSKRASSLQPSEVLRYE